MIASEPSPEPSQRLRRRAAVAALLFLVLAPAFVIASRAHVPEGCHAYRRIRGAAAWEAVGPGARLRIPFLHEFIVVPDRFSANDRLRVATREGAGVEVAYEVRGSVAPAGREAAARAPAPDALITHSASAALREAAAGLPGDEVLGGRADGLLGEAVKTALEKQGFEIAAVSVSARPPAGFLDAALLHHTLEHPVVLIGLDGADWQVAEPLIDSGRLPVLARLRASGAWGHLRSSSPMLSPLLWTTAATGKPPDQHGIIDFLVPDPATGKKAPISSTYRKVKALWNIFGGRGLTSAVVAWWATYPAEPVRGVMISDRVAYSLFDVGSADASGRGLVHPPALWESVRSRVVDAASITDAEVTRLAHVSGAEVARAREASRRRGEEASRDRLVHLLKIMASARTYHAVALDILKRGQPDLFALYYQGIDEVSHRFAHCAAPALPLCGAEDAARYGDTVAAYYAYQDVLLGEILSRVNPASYVIVLSDHGFRSGGDRPREDAPDIEGKPAKWHRLYGIALVSGPGIATGRLDNVTLLDIAPTVLRLAGLPQAADMTGRPMVAPRGSADPPRAVASYEAEGDGLAVASASAAAPPDAAEAEMLENLRSLGYIGGADSSRSATKTPPPEAAAGTPATLTAHTNVGAIHLQNGETAEAAREFTAALHLAPDYFPALMGLAEVRIQEGRLDEALALSRRAMESSPDPEPGVYLRYATLSIRTGAASEAADRLGRLRPSRPAIAEIPVALAVLAQESGRSAESESFLHAALDLDPAGTEAMSRLFQMKSREGDEADLEPAIRRALVMNPGSVLHRNWLGLILGRRGDAAGAEKEFKSALATAPDFGGTMANLGSLYGRIGRLEEAVAILERALRIEPENLECRVNLGAALGKLGRSEQALVVLKAGLSGGRPGPPELLNALAVAYAQKGEARRAGDLLRESLALSPDQPKIRAMLREIGRDR